MKLQRDMVDGGAAVSEGEYSGVEDDMGVEEVYPPDPETPEEREKFWQEVRGENPLLIVTHHAWL